MSDDRFLDGLEVYCVGGAVRDERLGWPVYDHDWVVVGASVEDMTRRGFTPVGRDFPVFLHPVTHEEYALARTERKRGHGYTGFVVHASPDVSLEEDLARRDLTINAMAESVDGTLVDPYHGQRDLAARRLRHVSPAFVEDPLRVLRTARFLARYRGLGFEIAEDTLALMRELAHSGELGHLVAERVWTETEKALGEPSPEAYFTSLDDCGALAVLMPELVEDREAMAAALERLHCLPSPQADGTTEAEGDADSMTVGRRRWRWARLLEHLDDDARAALAERLKLPKAYADLARQAARTRALRLDSEAAPLTARRVLGWYDSIDAWRRGERLAPQLALLALDAPRLARTLGAAYRAAQAIAPKVLLEEGFKGKALGEELDRRRQAAIAEVLAAGT
ncbi:MULTISPECIES: polynucleotide adenylyltransferase [Halomonadaceae]|uniref:polynucleotide adenylyltransferase n=1 Tax=Halomonadaceae TaxID=28256 RepID=UPI001581F035|nr:MULTISPECIES: polynucleotide adenylyltransferase [Halomonas]MDI4637021.1 polynucleotide adenylyltransferase [Halomonas sp. BMC7]NUJ58188.1 polynucleotide adenylyltransferase [Halomonas taeanensis]